MEMTVQKAHPSPQTASFEVEEDPTKQKKKRALWRFSDEYRSLTRQGLALYVSSVSILSFVYFVLIRGRILEPEMRLPIFAAASLLFPVALLWWAERAISARRAFMATTEDSLLSDLRDKEAALSENSSNNIEFPALWAVTQQRIDTYHRLATKQAEESFYAGLIAAGVGFISLIILGAFAAFSPTDRGTIAASVVGVAGAAMGSYIGATFMKAQSEASAQLRQFFIQPVEFSRMLGMERLLENLQDADRAKVIHAMVKGMVTTPVESKKQI